uniref:Nuclease n=1 Tax=viral metagenome TaxID=1070528 RepID=A0A6M3KBE4_9ZZZZ
MAIHKVGGRGYFRAMIYPQTRYDWVQAVKVRLSELGVELIDSPNFQCTMVIVKAIYSQHTKTETEHTLFKRTRAVVMPTKLTSDPAVGRLMGLAKRFPEKVAIRLIHQFGSIWGVIHADDSELLQVEGMGKGLLAKLKEGVGKE